MNPKTIRLINSSTDPTTAYAKAVVAGKVVAGPHVRDACTRHLRDLKEGPKRGLVWDIEAAERFFGFCRTVLRLSDGQFAHCTTVVAEGGERWSSGGLFFAKRSVPWSSKPSPPSAEHCTPMSL